MDLLLGDGQWRHETQSVGTGSDDEQTALAGCLDDGRRVLRKLETEDETAAANLLDQVREALAQGVEAGLEDFGLGGDGLLQTGVGEAGDDVVGQAAGEGVAAKGGAVVADLDLLRNVAVDDGGANGEAVAEGLGGGDDVRVGLLGEVGVGPESAGAGETALDLIVDEDGADLAAALGQGDQELVRRGRDAAFALNGLDNDTAGLLGDGLVDGGDVVEGAELEAGQHGRKGLLVLGVVGGGQAAHGAAVEGIVEGDDLELVTRGLADLGSLPGELDGGFVGLGAGVADEHRVGVVHGTGLAGLLDQQLGQGAGPRVVVEVRGVHERATL